MITAFADLKNSLNSSAFLSKALEPFLIDKFSKIKQKINTQIFRKTRIMT